MSLYYLGNARDPEQLQEMIRRSESPQPYSSGFCRMMTLVPIGTRS